MKKNVILCNLKTSKINIAMKISSSNQLRWLNARLLVMIFVIYVVNTNLE